MNYTVTMATYGVPFVPKLNIQNSMHNISTIIYKFTTTFSIICTTLFVYLSCYLHFKHCNKLDSLLTCCVLEQMA